MTYQSPTIKMISPQWGPMTKPDLHGFSYDPDSERANGQIKKLEKAYNTAKAQYQPDQWEEQEKERAQRWFKTTEEFITNQKILYQIPEDDEKETWGPLQSSSSSLSITSSSSSSSLSTFSTSSASSISNCS